MPTIYSSLYQNFIRQGLAKSLTHGYAQSVVAATHPHLLNSTQNRPSAFASRNSSRFSRLHTLHTQQAFQNERERSTVAALAPDLRHERALSHNNGLEPYLESFRKKHGNDEYSVEESIDDVDDVLSNAPQEWNDPNSSKRILWKPTADALLEEQADQQKQHHASLSASSKPPIHHTTASLATIASDSCAVEDPEEEGVVEECLSVPPEAKVALAHIDAALEREIDYRKRLESLEQEVSPSPPSNARSRTQSRMPTPTQAATPSAHDHLPSGPDVTANSQSQIYAGHLTSLAESDRFSEIPAVFEAMLVAGVQPLTSAYNALIKAAIHLPGTPFETVTKALNVYTDMLQRRVLPNSQTYDILVRLLSERSVTVLEAKRSVEEKRARFGGMVEAGEFLFASHEIESAILSEEDRTDLALTLFKSSVKYRKAAYAPATFCHLITACATRGRIDDMLHVFEQMETSGTVPEAAVFPAMITAYAQMGDLVSAIECYNEYRDLAAAHNHGQQTLQNRCDEEVYAAVVYAYIISGKADGGVKFFHKLVEQNAAAPQSSESSSVLVQKGFVRGFTEQGAHADALRWASMIVSEQERPRVLRDVIVSAADFGDWSTATAAFPELRGQGDAAAQAAIALLALSVREQNLTAARTYWSTLTSPSSRLVPSQNWVEATTMYTVSLLRAGDVVNALRESESMFARIKSQSPHLAEEVEEGVQFITNYMKSRGIVDPRLFSMSPASVAPRVPISMPPTPVTPLSPGYHTPAAVPVPVQLAPPTEPAGDVHFDPYARTVDYKMSTLMADDVERSRTGTDASGLAMAMNRLQQVRSQHKHPRYSTYAKLISAAARLGQLPTCMQILACAKQDVPLLTQYAAVRQGWTSILDAMVSACLTVGKRDAARQYHQELVAMGSAPSANTYGLYITTLKESTKTFDEATEALKIFHQAKSEGVEASPFLYNALIGKLGKARRIDDTLFYFGEMRALGIKPTSVTYGTVVNALCRVSDEKQAEDLFAEMESMPNYKARPAPYNSMMQFFLNTKRDKAKVLQYYERMQRRGIAPTAHTYKLLTDAHATLEPIDMTLAEGVLDTMRAAGIPPETVHYASLIHARGCVLHDLPGARAMFDRVLTERLAPIHAGLFQALFESMVANHSVGETEPLLGLMRRYQVELTPYIANTLIHGWAGVRNIQRARAIFDALGHAKREPSTYEAMIRAHLALQQREAAREVCREMISRGYPSAVVQKPLDLIGEA